MLENLIKVGAPSFLKKPASSHYRGDGGFCTIDVDSKVHNGQHIYLPFVPNGINWVKMEGGHDVISAPFSGCIMATYMDKGVRKVCHVSSGDFGDCTGVWNSAKVNFTEVREFKPSDFIGGLPHDYCYGLITTNLEPYTILTHATKHKIPGGFSSFADPQFVKKVKGTYR